MYLLTPNIKEVSLPQTLIELYGPSVWTEQ